MNAQDVDERSHPYKCPYSHLGCLRRYTQASNMYRHKKECEYRPCSGIESSDEDISDNEGERLIITNRNGNTGNTGEPSCNSALPPSIRLQLAVEKTKQAEACMIEARARVEEEQLVVERVKLEVEKVKLENDRRKLELQARLEETRFLLEVIKPIALRFARIGHDQTESV